MLGQQEGERQWQSSRNKEVGSYQWPGLLCARGCQANLRAGRRGQRDPQCLATGGVSSLEAKRQPVCRCTQQSVRLVSTPVSAPPWRSATHLGGLQGMAVPSPSYKKFFLKRLPTPPSLSRKQGNHFLKTSTPQGHSQPRAPQTPQARVGPYGWGTGSKSPYSKSSGAEGSRLQLCACHRYRSLEKGWSSPLSSSGKPSSLRIS